MSRSIPFLFFLCCMLMTACSSPKKPTVVPVTEPPAPAPEVVDPIARMVEDLAGLRFDRLGNPVLRWDSIHKAVASDARPHKLLVVMVEYQDRGFDRFAKDRSQGQKLADWYTEQLFDDTYQRKDSLSHYYATQSLGAYHVTGTVLPPVKLSKDRRAYGSPHRPAGGDWRNDADPEGLVAEALTLAKDTYADLEWADFDRWDPLDHDNDGELDEPDGYLDHFVLVFPGGGQNSCQRLRRVDQVLTANVGMDVLAKLDAKQRECADRIWPHRSVVKTNDGRGPKVAGRINPQGGVPLSESLWIRDYNMQSEYTGASTFIHEFGHSIGLPDVYSRTSSNSTGAWEVMSHTTDPSPQNMSAWSRLMLGWLTPKVVVPPMFGGQASTTVDLIAIDDAAAPGTQRAVMVALPPKARKIELTELPASSGKWALYSGQGNELERTATLDLDLRKQRGAIELSFDAWYEIEGGWDFAYVETSADKGVTWTRRLPRDARHMPAKHGHDGKESVPGFTGISGDLDGDSKNESNAACDPTQELAHGEDKMAQEKSACLVPTWVRPAFDLSDLAGKNAQVRVRYYTDMAAVMRGLLIDNVRVSVTAGDTAGAPDTTDTAAAAPISVDGDFEDDEHKGWKLGGFTRSAGSHDILVPHYYLVEYRDPYATDNATDADKAADADNDNDDSSAASHRYDSALATPGLSFYQDPKSGDMMALQVRHRPGVVIWYYNGAYAWSENDPAINGAGQGYLLALDSDANEIPIPGLETWLQGSSEGTDTHYDVAAADAQKLLAAAFTRTACFVRNADYLPAIGLDKKLAKRLRCGKGKASVGKLSMAGRPLRYAYEISNEILPGPAYDALQPVGELYDTRVRKGETGYRMYDRGLRAMHTRDAPFALEPFEDGVIVYRVSKKGLERVDSRAYPARPSFTESTPERWQNTELPFGGVAVPDNGLSITLEPVPEDAPAGTRARVRISWPSK